MQKEKSLPHISGSEKKAFVVADKFKDVKPGDPEYPYAVAQYLSTKKLDGKFVSASVRKLIEI